MRDPYSELDSIVAQAVSYATDCLNEGVISERTYIAALRRTAAWYRVRLLAIVRAEKEGAR